MGWFWSSSSPVLPIEGREQKGKVNNKSNKTNKSNKSRKTVQRIFEDYMKKLKNQILKNPFQSKLYTNTNDEAMESRLILSNQQLQQLVSNQKYILELSLQIIQCQYSIDSIDSMDSSMDSMDSFYSFSSISSISSIGKKKINEKYLSLLSQLEENTRDLFTHFDIIFKQQEDLIQLQLSDIRLLQISLNKLKKNKKCFKVSRQQSLSDSSDSFFFQQQK